MQRRISDEIHLGKAVSTFDSIVSLMSIDRTALDIDNAYQKLENIKDLLKKGNVDAKSLSKP